MNNSKKIYIFESILLLITFVFFLITKIPLLLNISFSICFFSILFSLNNIRKRSALFVFFICYFIFLIGGDLTLYLFDGIGKFKFGKYVSDYAYTVIIISNLTILISFVLIEKNYKNIIKKANPRWGSFKNKLNKFSIKKYINKKQFLNMLIIMLHIIFILSIISKSYEIYYVLTKGYYNYFVNFYIHSRTIPGLFIIQNIEKMYLVILCMILSFNINMKHVYRIFVVYSIYLVLTLFTGQRGPFMLGVFFMFVYLLGREEFYNYNIKKIIRLSIICIPIILILLFVIGNLRFGQSANGGFLYGIVRLINSQGVTINAIKNEFIHREIIPNKFYTMNFLYAGFFPIIFRMPRYLGNSVETALNGFDFNHALGYIVLGKDYLKGQGTGSSYIAETMHDGGIVYVILFSIIISALLYLISNMSERKYISKFVLLISLQSILWSIRGNATGFIAKLLSPTTVTPIILVLITYLLYFKLYKKGKNR